MCDLFPVMPAIDLRDDDQRRAALFAAQKGRCFYCWRAMHLPAGCTDLSPTACTLEHLVPLSRGGTRLGDNEVAACRSCNNVRARKPWVTFWRSKARMRLLNTAMAQKAQAPEEADDR